MDKACTLPFLHELERHIAGAMVVLLADRPWHSRGYGGRQLRLSVTLCGDGAERRLREIAAGLPDHIFTLTSPFVADIDAGDIGCLSGSAHMNVTALLLEA